MKKRSLAVMLAIMLAIQPVSVANAAEVSQSTEEKSVENEEITEDSEKADDISASEEEEVIEEKTDAEETNSGEAAVEEDTEPVEPKEETNKRAVKALPEESEAVAQSGEYGTLLMRGSCGATSADTVSWAVYDQYSGLEGGDTLVISGKGVMQDYIDSARPWEKYVETLTILVLEEGVTHIGGSAFNAVDFSGMQTGKFSGNLVLPESLKSIGAYAFNNCAGFSGELTLSDSLTSIGNFAFYGCTGLSGELTFPENLKTLGEKAFGKCSGFSGDLILPNNLTTIKNYTFYECSGFNGKLELPKSLEIIEDYAFYGCENLSGELVIPKTVMNIGASAFATCNGFSGKLLIPDSVDYIGAFAFGECGNIKKTIVLNEYCNWSGGEGLVPGEVVCGYKGSMTEANANYKGQTFEAIIEHGICGGTSVEPLYWIVYDTDKDSQADTIEIIGKGAMTDHSFENELWHAYKSQLKKLILNDGVTNIGKEAFSGFTNLEGDVTIPNTVTSIGDWAFASCEGLNGKLILSKNLETIGESAFMYCSNLSGNLNLPSGVTSIGESAFLNCEGFLGQLVLPSGLTTIRESTFSRCSGLIGELEIPDGVTNIERNAFSDCSNISTLTLPEGLQNIGDGAFSGDKGLKGTLTLPKSLKTIGDMAFNICEGFTGALILPEGLESIGGSAFDMCTGFTGDLKIPKSVKSIGGSAFAICDGFDGELILESGLESIGLNAFQGCYNLQGDLIIPDTVTSIGQSAFIYCRGLTGSLVLSENLDRIKDETFKECGFTNELAIPDSVQSIGKAAFSDCNFSGEIVLSENILQVGENAFQRNRNIARTTVLNPNCGIVGGEGTLAGGTIRGYEGSTAQTYAEENGRIFKLYPEDENDVYGEAIASGLCGATKEDHLLWTVYDSDADGEGNTLVIHGRGAMKDYLEGFWELIPWWEYKDQPLTLVLEEGITHIGEHAFNSFEKLTGDLSIPASVKSIGNSAFYVCSGLNGKLTLSDGLISIGDNAFTGTGFTGELVIPNTLKNIGKHTFGSCSGFSGDLIISEGVTSIGDSAFAYCPGFDGELSIPASITSVGVGVFESCSGFNKLTLSQGLKSIRDGMFSGCTGLGGAVVIPSSVTNIGDNAFPNISNITKVIIKNAECIICDSAYTLPDAVMISGLKDSTAQAYAEKYERVFEIYCESHSWSEGKVTKKPTCTEKGITTYTCTKCNGTKTEDIAELGHDYSSEWIIDKEATCIEAGSESRHCSRCDAKTDIRPIESTGEHDFSEEWTIDKVATCTEFGSKSHHCNRCDEKTDVTEIPLAEHSWDEGIVTRPATCEDTGEKILTCTICKETKTAEIKATGHTEVIDEAISPTCTESGMTEGKHCSECRKVLVPQEKIEALGHKWDEGVITKPATCADSGEKNYTCSVCNATKTESIPALEHDYSTEWTVDKEATCTEEGSKSHHCNRCDEFKDSEVIPVLSHNYDSNIVQATISENGSITEKCKICGIVKNSTIIYYPKTISLVDTSYVYDGSAKEPAVIVKDANGNMLVNKTDYTISYDSGRTDVGTYNVTVIFKGNYTGSKTLSFKIIPQATTTKLSLYGHDDVKVSWNKVPQTDGYKVYYRKVGARSWTTKGYYTGTSVTLPNLADGIKYEVAVRPYKTVDGTRYYASYTPVSIYTLKATTTKLSLYGHDDVKVTWSNIYGESGYKVYYRKAGARSWTTKGYYTGTSVTLPNLADGAKYEVAVRPYKTVNKTRYYAPYKTTSIYTLKRVSTPRVSRYGSKVKVTWSNIAGESGYQISRSTSKTGTYIAYTYNTTSGTYRYVSATKGRYYYYKVRAYRTVGTKKIYGPWSTAVRYRR